MSMTITVPEPLAGQLKRKAEQDYGDAEKIALTILQDALDSEDFPTVEEVVAKIRSTPPNAKMIRVAQTSLADALRNAPEDLDFNLEEWERQWSMFEEGLKATTIANDIAEGRC